MSSDPKVSTRERTDDALRQTEQSLAATLYSIGDGVIATDANGFVTRLNPVAERLTGWSEAQARGMPITTVFNIINEKTRRVVENPVDRVLREGVVVGLANHSALIAKDGTERPIADSGAPIRREDGTIIGSVLVFRDVTEERRAERALRESEERFRILVDKVEGYAIFMLDPEGRIVTWNAGAARLKGYTSHEIIGRHISTFYTPEDVRDAAPFRALQIAASEGRFEVEAWRVRKDGSRFWASLVLTALYDEGGELRGFAKITRDFTERRNAEETAKKLFAETAAREASEAAQEGARFLSEASALLSAGLDYSVTLERVAHLAVPRLADWCAVDVIENDKLVSVAVAHVDPRKVELAKTFRLRYPTDPNAPSGAPNVARTGKAELYSDIPDELLAASARDQEHLRIMRDLGLRSAIVVPLIARGRSLGTFTLVAAESNRRFLADDLALAEELGRRAGTAIDNSRLYRDAQEAIRVRDDFLSIAGHELKTPLAALQLQTGSVQRLLDKGKTTDLDKLRDRLAKIGKHGRRLERLINELLDVSRITSGRLRLEREQVDLAALAAEIISRFVDGEAVQGGALRFHAREPVIGHWDRLRLDQVITNLVSNAIKYGNRNPIDISVTRREEIAVFSVRDSGIGISAAAQTRIFDRYERAVEGRNYGGFGLGLWIARQVVEAHRGTIRVESAPEVGSTFTVELPCNARLHDD